MKKTLSIFWVLALAAAPMALMGCPDDGGSTDAGGDGDGDVDSGPGDGDGDVDAGPGDGDGDVDAGPGPMGAADGASCTAAAGCASEGFGCVTLGADSLCWPICDAPGMACDNSISGVAGNCLTAPGGENVCLDNSVQLNGVCDFSTGTVCANAGCLPGSTGTEGTCVAACTPGGDAAMECMAFGLTNPACSGVDILADPDMTGMTGICVEASMGGDMCNFPAASVEAPILPCSGGFTCEAGMCASGNEVPSSYAEFLPWVIEKPYLGWRAEVATPHVSSAPAAHTGTVRSFINSTMADALDASSADLPVGSASVKELWDDAGAELLGYAVMVKTADNDGTPASDWWRMVDPDLFPGEMGVNPAPMAEGQGSDDDGATGVHCMGCHTATPSDYFNSNLAGFTENQ